MKNPPKENQIDSSLTLKSLLIFLYKRMRKKGPETYLTPNHDIYTNKYRKQRDI